MSKELQSSSFCFVLQSVASASVLNDFSEDPFKNQSMTSAQGDPADPFKNDDPFKGSKWDDIQSNTFASFNRRFN